MSANDIQVIKSPGETRVYQTDDRTVDLNHAYTIKPGEPVMKWAVGSPYVCIIGNGDPEIGSDELVGICRKESTETTAANGLVEVISLVPGKTMLRGKATTSTNIDTAAEILALEGDFVSFDNTAYVITIDENEGTDENVHGLKIIDGDPVRYTLDVVINVLATEAAGGLAGQTMD